MAFAKRTLDIDHLDTPQPFAVTLDAGPLEQLLTDAQAAHRIYELALLERPGDLWDYLDVVPSRIPPELAARIDVERKAAQDLGEPWPRDHVPFATFDRLIRGSPSEGEAVESWIESCEGAAARAFIRYLFELLPRRGVRSGVDGDLVGYERARILAGSHPFSYLSRSQAIAESRRHPPNLPAHTDAFYAKMAELVRSADVGSVSVRGLGDHRLLRLLCERQRSRDDFEISSLTDREVNALAWDARIAWYTEDVGHGFLFVQDEGASERSVKDLVEVYATLGPGGLILSCRDEGDIAGYTREQGEGWYLYRSEVTPNMIPRLRRYHNVWSLMLAQENGELSDTQVVEIIAQWENFLSRRFPDRKAGPAV